TEPRPGFLALMPWVEEGPPERLRELGRQLAARSGHSRENRYRTGVLAADLTLPPSQVSVPPRTAHEEALAALLAGRAAPPRSRPLWPLLGLAALLWAAWCRKR
ncbi:MAG: carbon-nitrogen hydrolase family protein, partial [Deinococcota bacterium]